LFVGYLVHGGKVFPGNREKMDGGLGVDVLDDDRMFILEYPLGRDLIFNYLAEQTI
jgi:hypothetical protein